MYFYCQQRFLKRMTRTHTHTHPPPSWLVTGPNQSQKQSNALGQPDLRFIFHSWTPISLLDNFRDIFLFFPSWRLWVRQHLNLVIRVVEQISSITFCNQQTAEKTICFLFVLDHIRSLSRLCDQASRVSWHISVDFSNDDFYICKLRGKLSFCCFSPWEHFTLASLLDFKLPEGFQDCVFTHFSAVVNETTQPTSNLTFCPQEKRTWPKETVASYTVFPPKSGSHLSE